MFKFKLFLCLALASLWDRFTAKSDNYIGI